MSKSVYGPLNTLKRAFEGGDSEEIVRAVDSYLHALDTDYYDNNGIWRSDEDAAIKFLYDRMDSGVLCDELGCNAYQLEKRAKQVAWAGIGEPYNEEHIRMIMTLHNKGASDAKIAEIMGIEEPKVKLKSTPMDDKYRKDAVKNYENQGDLLK
jgi:hypothetical protein